MDTGAQCLVLSSGLVKHSLDKQLLSLLLCGKINVTDGAIIITQGPLDITMESAFSKHMIKCVILEDDSNDQYIIGTDFLAHPDIHAIVNFRDNCIKIQNVKLPLKAIAPIKPLTKLFLSGTCDNILEERQKRRQNNGDKGGGGCEKDVVSTIASARHFLKRPSCSSHEI
uniref:Uncharacterized protein n=1 Tax=Romanomermis culicivorax TaxID=13658 RepID=A0A915JXE5_ROMCU